MQIADRALIAITVDEVAARHHAVVDALGPRIILPAEHLGIENTGGGGISGCEIDKDKRVGCGHALSP